MQNENLPPIILQISILTFLEIFCKWWGWEWGQGKSLLEEELQ